MLSPLLKYSTNAKAVFTAPRGPQPDYAYDIVYSRAP